MRFGSCLFLGVALLIAGLAAFVAYHERGPGGRPPRGGSTRFAAPDDDGVQRLEAKKAVTERLIDGRLTLREAAAWFKYLNEATRSAGDDVGPDDAGLSEGERYCRQVIRWAETAAAETSTGRAREVVRRLREELAADRGPDGTIALPAPE